ncbi:MAG: glycosyltransferase family 4 protein [Desulfosarcina sp.]|nr:glycosyltransferase family 4 protein [Desulfosarcina sp.]MBC2742464.1 glycosyltransferase family 4 protein [Desulfosarcina sp.]MBC2765374.1 glycosyltransferase family 4 protein [Desulfosarcina sp.]
MVARKITVVQMLPELESGGVESVTLETAAFLAEQGHKSIVISGGGKMADQLKREGSHHLTWHHIGEKSPRCLKYIIPLRKLLVTEHVDILHLRSRLPAWVGYIAWKSLPEKTRPRLVTTFHGFYSVNAYSEIMAKGEKVIAISKAIAVHINTKYDVDDDRIEVIPEGINENLFSPHTVSKERINKLSEHWGLGSTDSPVIMLPGRITRLKGHDVFIKALTRIKHLQWNAVCVGAWDQKSSYYNELVDLVQHSGLTHRINFTGNCTDMPAAYMLSDIVVSASKKPESFGRTSVEAQAMGKMVIATAHGGSLETVLHNKTGMLVKPDHVDDLAEALKDAINRIPLDMNTVKTARSWIVENFTLNRMCCDTLNLYDSILH